MVRASSESHKAHKKARTLHKGFTSDWSCCWACCMHAQSSLLMCAHCAGPALCGNHKVLERCLATVILLSDPFHELRSFPQVSVAAYSRWEAAQDAPSHSQC